MITKTFLKTAKLAATGAFADACKVCCQRSICSRIGLDQSKKMAKKLAAFDFDHTIVDLNTDLHVKTLAPDGKIPKEITDLYSDNSWTNYMGNIFQYLHLCGVREEDMKQCMYSIPLVDGMEELLQYNTEHGWENIIISDSNSIFIEYILDHYKLKKYIAKVYTNPARYDEDGVLKISYYHTQDWCPLSTENLCKGHILTEHVEQWRADGVHFSQMVYVGDGTNDLCPALRLTETDIVFPRKNFRLAKKIKSLGENENNNFEADENALVMKAKVFEWETGFDILEKLKSEDRDG